MQGSRVFARRGSRAGTPRARAGHGGAPCFSPPPSTLSSHVFAGAAGDVHGARQHTAHPHLRHCAGALAAKQNRAAVPSVELLPAPTLGLRSPELRCEQAFCPLLLVRLQGEMGEEFVGHLEALAAKLEYVGGDDTARFSAAYRHAGAGCWAVQASKFTVGRASPGSALNQCRKGSMVGSHGRGSPTPKAKAAAGAGSMIPVFTRVPASPPPHRRPQGHRSRAGAAEAQGGGALPRPPDGSHLRHAAPQDQPAGAPGWQPRPLVVRSCSSSTGLAAWSGHDRRPAGRRQRLHAEPRRRPPRPHPWPRLCRRRSSRARCSSIATWLPSCATTPPTSIQRWGVGCCCLPPAPLPHPTPLRCVRPSDAPPFCNPPLPPGPAPNPAPHPVPPAVCPQVRAAYVEKVGGKMLDLFRAYWAAMERLEVRRPLLGSCAVGC